jgi:hypothetical protein
MTDSNITSEFETQEQRVAVCLSQFRSGKMRMGFKAYDDISMLIDELDQAGKL